MRETARHQAKNGLGFSLSSLLAPLGGEIRGRETVAELGMTDLAVTRGLDHGPGVRIREQGL